MKGVLLRLCLGCFLVILVSFAKAQNFRFIYIQTENQKPFYIKMGDHGMASSASGYMIIPRLTEGTHNITVGFPQSISPEILFTVNLNEMDAGYLIKNDADQGWYIVDLHTMEPVTIELQLSSLISREVVKSNDVFARILSEVVNDSTIREINEVVKQGAATVKAELVSRQNIPAAVNSVPAISNKPAIVNENKAAVLKIDQKITPEGLSLTYLDQGDTVDIFMAVSGEAAKVVKEDKPDSLVVAKRQTDSLRNIRFIDMELQNPNQQADSGTLTKDDFVVKEKKNSAANGKEIKQQDSVLANLGQDNAKCVKTATEGDFLQLRKAMAAENTEAEMQKLAVTEFLNTCFSTEQVKNLGVLFITEEQRYKFYVAAYPYVSDAANFGKLESQLTDSYYITRFKAMTQH